MKNPKHTLFNRLAITAILLSVLVAPTAGGLVLAQDGPVTRYVKPGLTGDCTAWAAACDLGAALAQSVSGDEIWAAEGTYYPDPAGLTDPRTATFQLKSGVALYGGFAGTETARDQRDPAAHLTILSGDLDLNNILDNGNAYHVVTGSGTDASAILDGFTVTAGVANGAYNTFIDGGGMYIKTGGPTLTKVAFSGNSATESGRRDGKLRQQPDPDETWPSLPTRLPAAAGCTTIQHPNSDKCNLLRQHGYRSRRRDGKLRQQPDPDRRHLFRQLGFRRRRDVELQFQQPDPDLRHLLRQHGWLLGRRRDVEYSEQQPNPDQRHFLRQHGWLRRRRDE